MHLSEENSEAYLNFYLKEVRQDLEELEQKLIKNKNQKKSQPDSSRPKNPSQKAV